MQEVIAMNRPEMETMLQVGMVDVGNGTLFGAAVKRPPKRSHLTLVISTGGSGMSSIKAAMRMADQKLQSEYRNYVKFIVVDSSTNEIDPVKKSGIRTLNISSPGAQTRAEYSNRSPFFREFMPKDYNILLLNEHGASQDRMTGKIKLYDSQNGSTNDNLFRQIILDLFQSDWAPYADLPVDIMILSGLSGGNGSGTFIDLAARAKKACQDAGAHGVTVYGYLMLPDTAERFASTDDAKQSLYRNGFAALKELESYMSIGFEQERKEVVRSTIKANDVTLSAINLPFDYPVLISGDYDAAVSMIAETIVNLVADSGGAFDQNAFYSNIGTARYTALSMGQMSANGVLKNGACPEDSHMYCGIGYAHASIPEKIVIPNIISKVCGRLYVPGDVPTMEVAAKKTAFCSKTTHLSRHEFEQKIRLVFGLDKKQELKAESLWNKIEGMMKLRARLEDNGAELELQDIVTGDTKDYLEGFHAVTKRQDATEALIADLKEFYNAFLTQAKSVMTEYGPRAMEYLYYGKGDSDESGEKEDFSAYSIKTLLDTVTNKFIELSSKPGNHPDQIPQPGLLERAKEALLKSKVNDWKGATRKAVQQDVYCGIARSMTGANGIWKKEFAEQIQLFIDCCIRFADVLETLTEFYTGEGRSLDAVNFTDFAKETGERNGVNLCSDQRMYLWVKQRVEQKVKDVQIDLLKESLIEDFFKNTEAWVSNERGKARKQYDEIMSKCCGLGHYATANNGLDLTITDYFAEILKDVPVSEQQNRINTTVQSIMARLNQSSRPSLRIQQDSFCVTNKTILVPQSLLVGQYGPMVKAAFIANLGVTGDAVGTVEVSSVADSIVCYQTSVAHALSSLKDLELWEYGYESVPSSTMHLNNGEYETKYMELKKTEKDHLKGIEAKAISPEDDLLAGVGLSWKHYPSVNVLAYQSDFTKAGTTTEAKYRRDVFHKKVEYALKEKILECEKKGNTYQYFLNLIPEDWTNLSVKGYRQREGGRYKRGQELFQYLKNQNVHSSSVWRKPLMLNGSAFFMNPFDFTEILNAEHWNEARVTQEHLAYAERILRKSTYLYQQMQDTIYRYYPVANELMEQESDLMQNYQSELFCELFLYGVINPEDEGYEWNVKVTARGGMQQIMSFGRTTRSKFGKMEKGLYNDKLILPLVYEKFRAMELDLQKLSEVKEEILDNMKEKDLDALVDDRIEQLQQAYDVYMELFGDAKDPVDELMEKYMLDDQEVEKAEQICKFYNAMKDVIKSNK